ncbi:hypothetical protein [Shinella sp.]|uniref:hypothetical protein n=1 Tax=Shinella sp. TaxID=1870904 RepID=UPI0028A062FB|nr:hypothetical protein [Shinella sp.]
MHSALPTLAPTSAPRYPTPLADAARERTRRLMATHMRSARVELAACTMIFAVIGFAAAYHL